MDKTVIKNDEFYQKYLSSIEKNPVEISFENTIVLEDLNE